MCEIGRGDLKTRNFTKFLFIFLSLKVFRHEESETQYFNADCFYIVSSQPNQRAAPVAHKSSGLAQLCMSTYSFEDRNSTHYIFSNFSPRFRCVTTPTSPGHHSYLGFLFWHLWLTHPLRSRVNTCVNVAPN